MNALDLANRRLARIALGLALAWCNHGVLAAESADAAEAVSLAELTSSRDAFDGKAVRVSGYLSIGFEKRSLCPAAHQAAGKDCVWLSGDTSGWRDLSGRYVTLHGVYSKQFLGHLGCCAGAVRANERPVPVPDPAHKDRPR
jgi:hypothetical protein